MEITLCGVRSWFGKGVFFCVNGRVDEKKLILKLKLYFPVYWEDYVMAKMVDDYSILIHS